jgi:indolepyruvate ferredoxin oxidoreductase beta subunit
MRTINFFLTGVGGQGTLLASNVLAQVGVRAGFDVKKAEVHGMAQRGGSVSSQIRWGKKIHSPLIAKGEVDYLVAFEKLEALRYVTTGVLRPGGTVLVGEMAIPPLSVSSGDDVYPDDERVQHVIGAVTEDVHFVPSLRLAEEAGNVRAHNVVVLGALSSLVAHVEADIWLDMIAERVPEKYVDVNEQAFQLGRDSLTR